MAASHEARLLAGILDLDVEHHVASYLLVPVWGTFAVGQDVKSNIDQIATVWLIKGDGNGRHGSIPISLYYSGYATGKVFTSSPPYLSIYLYVQELIDGSVASRRESPIVGLLESHFCPLCLHLNENVYFLLVFLALRKNVGFQGCNYSALPR